MPNLLSGKIVCANCGKNFKAKKERKRRVYVCSTYDNYGKEYCRRIVIAQEIILELLIRRYGEKFEVSKNNIQKTVENIVVEDEGVFQINLNNDKPIIFSEKYYQF